MAEDRAGLIPKVKMFASEQNPPSIFDEIFSEQYFLSLMLEQKKELDAVIDYACRYLVTPPIKGKITRGKVKWRGLRLVFLPSEMKMKKDGDKMNFTYEQRYELWQRDKKIF